MSSPHRLLTFLFLLPLTPACRTTDVPKETGIIGDECTVYSDMDGDGYGDPATEAQSPCEALGVGEALVDNGLDCDDGDASINPDGQEVCDGVDNNCDGEIDEGAADGATWYADTDGDGYGDLDSTQQACTAPDGFVADDTDCDDSNDAVHPTAPERCDARDNDCDGEIDEDLAETWYLDADGDGYGNPAQMLESCDPGPEYVVDASDCDDNDDTIYPGADEVCDDQDNDCDGEIDEGLLETWYTDGDGDGFGDADLAMETCAPEPDQVQDASDCDDNNSAIHPDAQEACNGLDDDCDGLVDDDDPDVLASTPWYLDADGDGYGLDGSSVTACDQPTGYSAWAGDCDDSDPAFHPGASEADCTDPNDYNCDGTTGWADNDADGFAACEECDDGDGAINPAATEVCDGVDNDCDGTVDEPDAADAATWYADSDGDGFGDAAVTSLACSRPSGSVADASDCDDSDGAIHPGAAEACNGLDDDCDGGVDEGVKDVFYTDADEDGFGDASSPQEACSAPAGTVEDASDCDDTTSAANPDATEVCDGIDNDCDGYLDESDAADAGTWYRDRDEDGYGDNSSSTVSCTAPSGYVGDNSDCNDRNDGIHPDATEICDSKDNDCDGTTDEDASDAPTWYADGDGDGYGDVATTATACSAPSGYVADHTDCDDSDGAIHPTAAESCDGIDNDCDGSIDEGLLITYWEDADSDGWGDVYSTVSACSAPSGYVSNDDDCDDDDSAVNPTATELCDYDDNDCDGSVDETFRSAGAYVTEAHCGYCDNDCGSYMADNATFYCQAAASTPWCDFLCDPGFYDADGDEDNGCECAPLSADDTPFDGIDADCDGNDGDPADAVYVSVETGSAAGSGSPDDPLDSIGDGIALASSAGLSWVVVAKGSYHENIWLEDGVTLYGGYATDFSERDANVYTTIIDGTGSSSAGPATVAAADITVDTLLDGFTIIGSASAGAGQSAIAVWLQDCSDTLVLANNFIEAEDGRDGNDGDDAIEGADGTDGADGITGTYADCAALNSGGSGGTNTCEGASPTGGAGGDAICPSAFGAYQDDGDDGLPTTSGGAGGSGSCDGYISSADCSECFIATCWNSGGDGSDGADGADGAAGVGATDADGSVSTGVWLGASGADGVLGDYGAGGGGGGVGSGAYVYNCSTSSHMGGTGGGGGAGGCSGEGGEGGDAGGASIGLLLRCTGSCPSLPILTGNIIEAGIGGYGGDGGDGGPGGMGGVGGFGGAADRTTAWCGQDGGDGGDGGEGGGGGGGGGGAGGVSYAVLAMGVVPDAIWASAENTLSYDGGGPGGRGGMGGNSSTNSGVSGVDGAEGEQNW